MTSEFISSIPQEFLPKDEASLQELKALLSTLPTEMGWWWLCQYHGVWIPLLYLKSTISFQNHFEAQDSDVLLVTQPKSGTTWLKAIIYSLMNRKSIPIESHHHPLLTNNPHQLVPFLEELIYLHDQHISLLESLPSPRILTTHLPYSLLPQNIKTNSKLKMVYLCRNPKDVFVSLFQFGIELGIQNLCNISMEEAFDLFCRGISPVGPFWNHALEYWNLSKDGHVLFIRFEDLKENPTSEIGRLAEFLGCPFSNEEENSGVPEKVTELCSFENLSKFEVNRTGEMVIGVRVANSAFFRKGEVGDWKNHLGNEMIDRINLVAEEKLRGSGLIL